MAQLRNDQLPRELQAYRDRAETILGWMTDDWLDQDEFDRLSREMDMGEQTARVYDPGAVILSWDLWQENLGLLQQLQRVDMVDARENAAGKIEYRARMDAQPQEN